jgi:hypothetical protein
MEIARKIDADDPKASLVSAMRGTDALENCSGMVPTANQFRSWKLAAAAALCEVLPLDPECVEHLGPSESAIAVAAGAVCPGRSAARHRLMWLARLK